MTLKQLNLVYSILIILYTSLGLRSVISEKLTMFSTIDFLSACFMVLSLTICNILTFVLLKYHSSILYINRNIFIYLNTSLIISISAMVTEQSLSEILKLVFGPLPSAYALFARTTVTASLLLFHGIVFNLNMFRILLVHQVRFTMLRKQVVRRHMTLNWWGFKILFKVLHAGLFWTISIRLEMSEIPIACKS